MIYFDANLKKYGYLVNDKFTIECKYDELKGFKNDYSIFALKNKYGIIKKNGEHFLENKLPCIIESSIEEKNNARKQQYDFDKDITLDVLSRELNLNKDLLEVWCVIYNSDKSYVEIDFKIIIDSENIYRSYYDIEIIKFMIKNLK